MTSQVRLNYMGTPRDKTMSMKEWALSYAARDWPVFPVHSAVAGVCNCGNGTCKDVGKHPRTMHGFKDASTDPKIINEWWDESPNANIGMPTGEVSGLVVVDVDRKSGGLETWVDFQDFHGRVDTLTTLTGGGGFHHFFQTNSQQFKSSAGRLGDGIDIRANGGYIILPPSVHAPGDVYEWEADDDVIAPIPDWLVSKMRNIGKQPSTPAPETNGTVVEGSRNDSLTQLAGAARRAGASVAGINAMLQQENTANCNPPLDVSEVAGIAHSISRYDPARLPLIGSTDDAEWDVVDAVLLGEGKSFYLRAADIRKGKTGVHAKVEVGLNKTILGFSVLNSDRSRDRQDLIKGCSKRLDAMGHSAIGGEVLAAYLDDFCRNLWRNSIKDFAAAKVGGDPSIPVVMAVGDYIIVGGGTIMSAPPGRGKSYVALLMAISADAGTSKVWPVPKAQKALYVNLERSKESIQRRIGQCNVALDLEPGRPMLVLNARGKSLADVRYAVESAVKNDGVEVLFLDSISRSGQGSLLGDQETNSTIDLLNNLCPTWLAIGHTPRSDDSHVFGSIHFEAGADLIVRLASEPADNRLGIGLKVEKANDTPRPPMQYLALEFDSHGLNKVRHAHYGEFPELEDQKLSIENLLVDYIKGKGGKTDATNAAKDLGLDRSVVSTTLNQGLKFVKLEKVGKSQFFGVKTNATP